MNSHPDHLDYDQSMDDLSIIDDIYSSYDQEQMSWDNRAVNENDALKEQMMQQLIQTESQFLGDLDAFQSHYITTMRQFQVQKNKLAFQPQDGDIVAHPLQHLTSAHHTLVVDLRQRLSIYGPTQITSDIFYQFFERMNDIYTDYMESFSLSLMTLDRLQKTNTFVKFTESCRQLNPSLKEFGYYLRLPLTRISVYTQTVERCTQLTEPSHPDYLALIKITQQYKNRQSLWQPSIDDCLAHYKVYECYRLVRNSPALVTPTRRLILHSELTHIDPSLPTDLSDRRTYILYNDLFIFCKHHDNALYYHGIVILDQTVLKPLDTKIANKILQHGGHRKRSLFGIKKQEVSPGSPRHVYGLELFFQFVRDKDATTYLNPILNYGGGVANNVPSSDSLRRHILLMNSMEEQQLWMNHLQQVIKSITSHR
ncbi:Dbl homology domain-containing protein [Chlamydoabsidia padenii]|nr:Dbl homology domain-containing protein [Chlamydoabsidia padenii]